MPSERDLVRVAYASSTDFHANLRSLVALGLTVAREWDRAERNHSSPSAEQVARFDDFTDAEAAEFLSRASGMLRDYAGSIPQQQPRSFWLPVWQGVLSAFVYSVMVVVAAVLTRLGGHDLIDIARDALKPG